METIIPIEHHTKLHIAINSLVNALVKERLEREVDAVIKDNVDAITSATVTGFRLAVTTLIDEAIERLNASHKPCQEMNRLKKQVNDLWRSN